MSTTVLRGQCASMGMASGRLFVIPDDEAPPVSVSHAPQQNAERLRSVFDDVEARILEDAQLARNVGNTESADVFEAHAAMLNDDDLRGEVLRRAHDGLQVFEAVDTVIEELAAAFRASASEYLRARVEDLIDLGSRLMDALAGRERRSLALGSDTILVARDFTPSMTAELTADNCGGMVALEGSYSAHASIFARNAGIPAIIGCGDAQSPGATGATALLNASAGQLVINPDAKALAAFSALLMEAQAERRADEGARGIPVQGPHGVVRLLGNVGSLKDVQNCLDSDSDGVGLFRSEFLFLARDTAPTEDEQHSIYARAAVLLGGRPLIIRTLDIGADKQVPFLRQNTEANPALGVRGVRLCLKHPEIFEPQLRALARASADHPNIWVMVPMITSTDEFHQVTALLNQQVEELRRNGIPAEVPSRIGVMIETPAAVVAAEQLAKEADFFSIGTNDLVQYLYAIDRESAAFRDVVNSDDVILRVVEHVIRVGREAGIHVGVCGELAAKPEIAEQLVRFGVHELSMSPPAILKVRRHFADLRPIENHVSPVNQLTRK